MSIRKYIFGLLTSLVLLIAIMLSYQSASLFIKSFQMVIEDMMLELGRIYPEPGSIKHQILDYHITTQWQEVPKPVRDHFPNIPKETNKLHSKFVDWIYLSPPKKIYSLMVVEHNEKYVFVSSFDENVHEKIKKIHKDHDFIIDPIVRIILFGLGGIGLFVIVLLSIFKKMAGPMERLQKWAKNLGLNDLERDIPDFKFKELNDLSSLIHSNLVSVANSIEREQDFLGYASHELRTPIAVLRSNSALLEKISPNPSEKEREVRDRISRASLTMKSMTETLLWMSRGDGQNLQYESINLGELIHNIHQELSYLLVAKDVNVKVDSDSSKVSLALTPSVIVLNNLIRNAFQHTQKGDVIITQRKDKVRIENIECDDEVLINNKRSLGFGLGMQLVEKLTAQFGWYYEISQQGESYQVDIAFTLE